jgi:hypothetical protein
LQCVVEASRGLAWNVEALVIELLGMHSERSFQRKLYEVKMARRKGAAF